MSTELLNLKTNEIISFTNCAWEDILEFAIDEGWRPQGTVLYKDDNYLQIAKKWDGDDYTSHQGQVIESKDGESLGVHLKAAIKNKQTVKRIEREYDSNILSVERIEELISKFLKPKFTKVAII